MYKMEIKNILGAAGRRRTARGTCALRPSRLQRQLRGSATRVPCSPGAAGTVHAVPRTSPHRSSDARNLKTVGSGGAALLSLHQEDQENVNPGKLAPAQQTRAQAVLKAGNVRVPAPQQRLKTRRVKGRGSL